MQANRRSFLQQGLAALALLAAGNSQAAPARTPGLTPLEAINKAGRLRMLSQRITKVYCQIGQGILARQAEAIRAKSVTLFDEHMVELSAFAPSREISDTYRELTGLWVDYRALAVQPPSLAGARVLANINESVLRRAHLGTNQLQMHFGGNASRLVNISGRQRMLSQRLAKFYMLRRWGITSAEMEREAQVARNDFVRAHDILMQARENSPQIAMDLTLVQSQWAFFEEALKLNVTSDATLAQNVATTSERILEVMDRVTGLYAKLD